MIHLVRHEEINDAQEARVPGQNVHVLWSVADALGDIGSPAARALPALRDMTKIPRATWNANLAIKKIGRR
jgi:hypothetical protein